jgi:hypothetical protein
MPINRSAPSFRLAIILQLVWAYLLIGIGSQSAAQIIPDFPSRTAKTSIHDETPEACMAYVWWNRLTWDSLWLETYTYSPAGLLIETIHREHYPFQGMQPRYKYLFTYDGLDRRNSMIQQIWGSGTYTNLHRSNFYYDRNGRDSVTYNFQWAQTVSGYDWDTVQGVRNVHTYTPTLDITATEISDWTETTSGSYWKDQSKNEYHFSVQGEWDTVTYYHSQSGSWVVDGRWADISWHDYSQDQIATYTTQLPNGGWTNIKRMGCTYNGKDSDCLTETYTTGWDSSLIQYVRYDTAAHLVLNETWTRQSNQWEVQEGQRYNYLYDSQGHTLEMYDEVWDLIDGYVASQKYVYNGLFVATTPQVVASTEIHAFPNPATNELRFAMTGIENGPVIVSLYDMQGHLRLQCRSAYTGSEIKVPLSPLLEAGPYIYQVASKSHQAHGKVILLGQ